MPNEKSDTQKRGVLTKANIEAFTPIAIVFMGFIIGMTCIITDNDDPTYITLATGMITGGCGIAAQNSKDVDEVELEKYRYEQLGNQALANKDNYYGGI